MSDENNQRPWRRVCKICGKDEAVHHKPEYLAIPPTCQCDWREWDFHDISALPPVCSEYVGDGIKNCLNCEHDKACHCHAPNVKLCEGRPL